MFGDLIRSGVVPSVALTEIFRQAQQSAIIRNAHAVNEGRAPDLKGNQGDFFFLCRRAPDRLVQTVVELCKTRLPRNMGIPADQIQVLTPTRRGETGTVAVNRALQAALNPPARGKRQKNWGDTVFREGDRVMQTKNNYDVIWEKDDGTTGTGIFNGDVGIIQEIDPSGELITIRFDDRTTVYTADLLGQLDIAYAVTVHKAQGSEYRAVVLLSAPAAASLLVRGVLYTAALTRARELLILVGDDGIPGRMAANDRKARRYSGLRRRLKEGRTHEPDGRSEPCRAQRGWISSSRGNAPSAAVSSGASCSVTSAARPSLYRRARGCGRPLRLGRGPALLRGRGARGRTPPEVQGKARRPGLLRPADGRDGGGALLRRVRRHHMGTRQLRAPA